MLLEDGRVRRGPSFTPGRVYVDGLGVGDVGNAVLRERGKLSEEGICVAVVQIDQHSRVVEDPQLIQQGVIYERESADLLEQARTALASALAEVADNGSDPALVRRAVSSSLGRFWKERTGRRPVILPILVQV